MNLPMKVFKDIIQGTPEWKLLRKSRPTASNFDQIITPSGNSSKSAQGYIRELIAEAFCPDYEYFSGNRYTEQGKQLEPEARELYAKVTGAELQQVGFVLSDDGVCGCSPDSLIKHGESIVAGLEIKCPTPKTHVDWILDDGLPACHAAQVHGSMIVTGLRNWVFMSYYPGLKPLLVAVKWDGFTDKLATALALFVADYKAAMQAAIPKLKLEPITALREAENAGHQPQPKETTR